MAGGAPTALVSLIGHRQYRRCSKDVYYFLQVRIHIILLLPYHLSFHKPAPSSFAVLSLLEATWI